MQSKLALMILSLFASAMFFGCGSGGSSSSSTTDSTSDDSTAAVTGVASDPYIYNATFDEVAVDGTVLQSSVAPSSMTGQFSFASPLTVGSSIVMTMSSDISHATPGGNLSPYNGQQLTRSVSQSMVDAIAAGDAITVTPLTTYAHQLQVATEGLTEVDAIGQMVSMINNPDITAENLFANPMAPFETDGDHNPELLQASMAFNMAAGVWPEEFDGVYEAARDLIASVIPVNSDGTALTEAQFIAANAIAAVITDSDSPLEVSTSFNGPKIDAIIEAAAALGEGQVLTVQEDGSCKAQLTFKFSQEWLNGRTLYNVYFDDDDNTVEIEKIVFTDTKMIGYDFETDTVYDERPYTITEEGYITYLDTDDGHEEITFIKAVEQTDDYLGILWTDEIESSIFRDDEYFFFAQQTALDFGEDKLEDILKNTETVTISGKVVFKDADGNTTAVPSDAAIRIISDTDRQNNAYDKALSASINSDGIFSITQDIYMNSYAPGHTFNVDVFKNDIESDEMDFNCGEDLYRYIYEASYDDLFAEIIVVPSDFRDRDVANCSGD